MEGTWVSVYTGLGAKHDEFTLDSTDGEVSTGTGTYFNDTSSCKADVEVRHCIENEPAGDCPSTAQKDQYTLRFHATASGGCGNVADLADGECFLSEDEKTFECTSIGKYTKQD
jgi:hypothetical protein